MSEAATSDAPRDSKKLFGFIFAALNLFGLGIGAYLVYVSTLGVKNPSTTEAEARVQMQKFEESLRGEPVIYTMTPFNTVLDGIPRRDIHVKINLEMLDQEGFEEIIDKTAHAKDVINRVLNSKTFADIESVQGKLDLKNEMIADLNGILDRGVVKNVYFSEFVVQ